MIESDSGGPTNLRSIRLRWRLRVLLSERIPRRGGTHHAPFRGVASLPRTSLRTFFSRSPQAVGPSGVLRAAQLPGFVGSCPTSQCRRSARSCVEAGALAWLKPRRTTCLISRGGRRLSGRRSESAQRQASGDRPPLPGGQARRRDRNRTGCSENTVKVHFHKGRDRLACRCLDERWEVTRMSLDSRPPCRPQVCRTELSVSFRLDAREPSSPRVPARRPLSARRHFRLDGVRLHASGHRAGRHRQRQSDSGSRRSPRATSSCCLSTVAATSKRSPSEERNFRSITTPYTQFYGTAEPGTIIVAYSAYGHRRPEVGSRASSA